MRKLYEEYLKRKRDDSHKLYLFSSGYFYIFLAEDAEVAHQFLDLKIINYAKDIGKCGFPKQSLNKYLELFKINNLEVEIIEPVILVDPEKIIRQIKDLDLTKITPLEAFNLLEQFQRELLEEN